MKSIIIILVIIFSQNNNNVRAWGLSKPKKTASKSNETENTKETNTSTSAPLLFSWGWFGGSTKAIEDTETISIMDKDVKITPAINNGLKLKALNTMKKFT